MKQAAFDRVPQLDLRVLRRARELIEKGWTTKWFAKTKTGRRCAVNSPYATFWCAMGALQRAVVDTGYHDGTHELMRRHLYPMIDFSFASIAAWNDEAERTQSDVIELFNKAIAKLEAEVRVQK